MVKALPDHGILNETESFSVPVTLDSARAIAAKHNLAGREKALLSRLNNAAWIYQAVKEYSPPKIAEQRKLVKLAHDLSSKLDEVLSKFGPHELRLLFENTPEEGYRLKDVILAIHQLRHSSGRAVNVLPSNPGRAKDYATRYLFKELYTIYTDMTGDTRRYTFDDHNSEFKGPAINFIQDSLEVLVPGHKLSNSRVADLIAEAADS